eukprot:COSAG02_NODE_1864_length_10606_cov_17.350148_3_plen_476_part_00
MGVDLATASPALAGGIPVAGAAVTCSGPAWITSWVAGFMADYRAQFRGDGRVDNGGGHPSENRRKYDPERKAMWINAVDQLELAGDPYPIATALRQKGGILSTVKSGAANPVYLRMKANISSWRMEPLRSEILHIAALKRSERRGLVKPKGSALVHHPEMEAALKDEIVKKRAKKRIVTTRWLRVRAKQLIAQNPQWSNGHQFEASGTWRRAFMRRADLTVRRKTNSKRHSVIERRELLLNWHRRFRLHLQGGEQQCPIYGRYDREHRFNVDQVPLPFVIEKNQTVDLRGVESVQIKTPGESYEKRQATLQICFRGIGEQPKLAIIFRGKVRKHRGDPQNISRDEMHELNAIENVDWYFQDKAWADPVFTRMWLKHTLGPEIKRIVHDGKHSILIADNLAGQDARISAGDVGRHAKEAGKDAGTHHHSLRCSMCAVLLLVTYTCIQCAAQVWNGGIPWRVARMPCNPSTPAWAAK